MKWKNKGHEFDHMLNEKGEVTHYPPTYLWGAGQKGEHLVNQMEQWIPITGFVDSYTKKPAIGKYPIYAIDKLNAETDHVYITIENPDIVKTVSAQLEKMGFVEGVSYFSNLEIQIRNIQLFSQWVKQSIELQGFHNLITTYCSLQCKHCAGKFPFREKKHMSLDELKRDAETIFQWVDYVEHYGLIGGDAMMHPDLIEMIQFARETYGERIHVIGVWTNGVIMPSPLLLETMKKYNAQFRITDYGEYCASKQKLEEFKKICDDHEIYLQIQKFDEWIDNGDYEEIENGIPEKILKQKVRLCRNPKFCFCVHDQKLLYCNFLSKMVDLQGYELKKEDYYDLSQYSPEKKREFIEFQMGYGEEEIPFYCKYCVSILNKKIPVGEQL